jgi:hypothetical protein
MPSPVQQTRGLGWRGVYPFCYRPACRQAGISPRRGDECFLTYTLILFYTLSFAFAFAFVFASLVSQSLCRSPAQSVSSDHPAITNLILNLPHHL